MRPAIRTCAIASLALALAGSGAWAANLLTNPGFETVGGGGAVTGWTCPDYWSGSLASTQDEGSVHSGRRAALLKATLKQDRTWGRIHSGVMPIAVGLRYRVAVWAKGTGSLKVGAIQYLPKPEGGSDYLSVWQEQATGLSDQWQEVAYEWTITEPRAQSVAVMIEVEGEQAVASLDDAFFGPIGRLEGALTLAPAYVMAPLGGPVELDATANAADAPLAGGTLSVLRRAGDQRESSELKLDAKGRAALSLAPTGDTPGLEHVDVACADLGAFATAYVDRVERAEYDSFEAAAAKTVLGPGPQHLLFLGDSLTDMSRGFNYADQVAFWLRKVHGERVTFRNAGVGGDMITRVWDRLNGVPTVYRANAYDGLFVPPPARIFIFLGHNDSKLTSGSGFQNPVVPLEDYGKVYREVIGLLRQRTQAKITILSATSSVYEITKPMAEKLVETRGSASLFGKPEVLEQFNAVAREVAADTGCDYVDVYDPTRTYPDKPRLFTRDGVHLSLAGNHLIALKLLEYLGTP